MKGVSLQISKTPKFLFIGASGFIGRQILNAQKFHNSCWIGRKSLSFANYFKIEDYTEKFIRPLLAKCDIVVHLAAVTRDSRSDVLKIANITLVESLIDWIKKENPNMRFIFMSTDLAAYQSSPYGVSKKSAEEFIGMQDMDCICLRASVAVGRQIEGLSSTIDILKKMATVKYIPIIGTGRFYFRPLWIDDLIEVIKTLGERKGKGCDRGTWSMFGEEVLFRDFLELIREKNGGTCCFFPIPLWILQFAGKLLRIINPSTSFPVDFIRAIAFGEMEQPKDIFKHLNLKKSSVKEIIAQI